MRVSNTNILLLAILSLATLFVSNQVQAQRVSATLAVDPFSIGNSDPNNGANVNYNRSVSFRLDARVFTNNLWAFKVGAGMNNLEYSIGGGGVEHNYDARRRDWIGVVGIEKHFKIADFIYIYPGVQVPIKFLGQDKPIDFSGNLNDIESGEFTANIAGVLGANIKLLKVMRVGVEFDMTYGNFKNDVWNNIADGNDQTTVSFSDFSFGTHITLGVAF